MEGKGGRLGAHSFPRCTGLLRWDGVHCPHQIHPRSSNRAGVVAGLKSNDLDSLVSAVEGDETGAPTAGKPISEPDQGNKQMQGIS